MRLFEGAALGAVMIGLLAGPGFAQDSSPLDAMSPVTDEMLQSPPDGDWLQYRRTYNGWGFSPLSEITTDNVKNLTMVWSRAMSPGTNEGTPLIHDGVMFVADPAGGIQAINAVTGGLLWEYKREIPREAYATGQISRSLALYDDKVLDVTWDNVMIALDAKTGQVVWETERPDGLMVSNSSGPIAADGVVVAGSTCAYALAGGCYAAAYSIENGEALWVNYPVPRPGEPGDETWGGLPLEARIHTGVWGGLSYDPETGTVYYGSSSTAPSSPTTRGTSVDDVLAGTDTRWAVDLKSGEVKWQHQVQPGAMWDEECTFETILDTVALKADPNAKDMLAIGPNGSSGEMRKVATGVPCKNGLVYTLDAETGEFLWAKQTVYQNQYTAIDEKGVMTLNDDNILKEVGQTYNVCPTFLGGRDWSPVSYNPESKVMFVPLNNLCADMTPFDQEGPVLSYEVDSKYTLPLGNTGKVGRIDAINMETGDTVWTYEQEAPNYSPTMATAGGLVFSGGQDRYFRAHSQEDGSLLWKTRLPAEVTGHAVSFAVDGKQYIAVESGLALVGGSLTQAVAPDADYLGNSNGIFVFALPE